MLLVRIYFWHFHPNELTQVINTIPQNTPKVVGGITHQCTDLACATYNHAIETTIPVSSTRAAELVKLYENTFRSVNIAMANEMALIK